jgi:hypothetical protein
MAPKDKVQKLFKLVDMEQKSLRFTEIILEKLMIDTRDDFSGISAPCSYPEECVLEMKLQILNSMERIYIETYNDEEIDFLLEHLSSPLKQRIEENENQIYILLESELSAVYEKHSARLTEAKSNENKEKNQSSSYLKKADLITLASNLKTGNKQLPYEEMLADISEAAEKSGLDSEFDSDFLRKSVVSPLKFLKKRIAKREILEMLFSNNPNASNSTSRTSVYFAKKVLKGEIEPRAAESLIGEVLDYCENLFNMAGLARQVTVVIGR